MSFFPIIPPLTGPVVISQTATFENASDLTTYTFNGVAFGAAAPDRIISIGFLGRDIAGNVASVTLGGVSATQLVEMAENAKMAFFHALVPNGTTGTVEIVGDDAMSACCGGVWRVTGASTTISDTGQSTATPLTDTIATPANGGVIACVISQGNGPVAWTNLTERFDQVLSDITNIVYSGAHDINAVANGSLTVTATITGSDIPRMVQVAYAPR